MSLRLIAAAVLCACAASAFAAQDSDASKAFVQRARAYVKLDAPARAAYHQGDLFTADIVDDFRRMIRKAFDGKDGRNMRRTIRESDPVRVTVLHANDIYPEDIPQTTMPPTLLRRLPALPAELAYRIVGRALVIQELRTNIVVDFMPDAIPGRK
jgi:hypothetical protein